jgi:diacylglycerol kinase family enzyme
MHEPVPGLNTRIAIVSNPRSGSAPQNEALSAALRAAGVTATMLSAPRGAAFEPWLAQQASRYDVLVAVGGDGTVSTVARAAVKAKKTLAVIPTGTRNHFARDAGIPLELDRAVAVLAQGRQQCIDAGIVNGRLFLNNVSLGNYPRMVRRRAKLEGFGIAHRIAGAMASARTWWTLRNVTASLSVDGINLLRRSPFIVVANGRYVLSGLELSRREQINDGCLSLYVAPPTGRLGALALPLRALTGMLSRQPQFETYGAATITATVGAITAAAIDGEVCQLESPLTFNICRQALRVLLPPFDFAQRGPEPAEAP